MLSIVAKTYKNLIVDMKRKILPFSYAQAYVATKIGDEKYQVVEIKQKEKGKGE